MTTDTKEKILNYLQVKKKVRAKELQDFLGISRQGLFLQIAQLMQMGKITKVGRPPKVYYFLSEKSTNSSPVISYAQLSEDLLDFVNQRYLYITPLGEKLVGMEGFFKWCEKTQQNVAKTLQEYVKTQKRYDRFIKNDVINGLEKLKQTFPKVYLDKLFYLDFYSIERFGKTKLGQLLLYAKQSQSREIITELVSEISPKIDQLIHRYNVQSVAFIPPTVRREVQLMKELERQLALPLRKLQIAKLKSELMVPQKTLAQLVDRVENAAKTIVVEDDQMHENILLIDDAVGSGATLNETARQIREKKIVKGKIIGLSIVGSFKGFDVISEI